MAVVRDPAEALRVALEGVLAIPFSSGNRVEALRNGNEIFPAMLTSIERAKASIDFESFVFWKGNIATRFVRALSEAARRGVQVRVLLDAVGSMPMTADDRGFLVESGVRFVSFRPIARWRFWEVDHRTHRKILVCDDEGFTGGVGIGEEWTGDARAPDEWRETHFRIRGPAVALLRATFLEHWVEGFAMGDASELARTLTPPARVRPEAEDPGSCLVQVVPSAAAVGWSRVELVLHCLLANARRRVRITTAYFVPDDSLLGQLCSAAHRGVEVEILLPGTHTDQRSSQLAGEDVYARLLESGVRIYRYEPTMLHTKVVTVDGELSLIGSANFNHRSLLKDDEICLNVLDRDLTARLDRDFDADRAEARAVDASERWDRRSIPQRIGESLARLVRRQL